MDPEQIEAIKNAITATKNACAESEMLISDYLKCESEVARKYLAAAIKKHASSITSNMPSGLFN